MRENFFLHKMHSLTGIFPVGYYLVQHLTLNTFSLGGPEKFDGVIGFFHGMPKHVLYAMTFLFIWLPLAFHAVYGLFISARSLPNVTGTAYRYRANWLYTLQRVSGIAAFVFLCYHIATTSIASKVSPAGVSLVEFAAWTEKLSANGYLLLFVYMLGVVACTWHFSYGIWNFCIRWGISVSERAQLSVFRFSMAAFVATTAIGWLALFGFLMPHERAGTASVEVSAQSPQHR